MHNIQVESNQYREIAKEIPKLQFHPSVQVSIVPPYGGAVARFYVHYKDKTISVYLDWFDNLGVMEEPYYETYLLDTPLSEPDRFYLNETEEMMQRINDLLGVE